MAKTWTDDGIDRKVKVSWEILRGSHTLSYAGNRSCSTDRLKLPTGNASSGPPQK